MKISGSELKATLENNQELVIIDVRRKSDYDEDPRVVPGATWYDLDQIDDWSQSIASGAELIVYCAHGRSRSQAAHDHFEQKGYSVKLLEGGYDHWRDDGGEVVSA